MAEAALTLRKSTIFLILQLFYMKRILRWIPSILFALLMVSMFASGDYRTVYMMPMSAVGAYVCQRLQADLVDYFKKNVAQFRTGGSTALIKWLLSPQNRSGFVQINPEAPILGKKRGVAFRTESPFCFNLCSLNVLCTEERETFTPEDGEITFDLTDPPYRHCDSEGNPVLLRFTEDEMMKYCKNDDTTWMRNKIARYLLRWEEALDKVLSTIISAHVGTNHLGASVTNIPIFTSGNTFTPNMSVLNPEALWYINQLYQDIGHDGQFAMIGGTIINKIAQFKSWATANAAGVDMSKQDAINPYPFYDRHFNPIYGQSDFLILAPGTVQLVTWNKYKGEKRREVTNLYTKGTVTLPTTGLQVDFHWKYDPDCEIFTFEPTLSAELAVVPAGGCTGVGGGVDFAAVNGIMRIHDCGLQPLVPACPDGASS